MSIHLTSSSRTLLTVSAHFHVTRIVDLCTNRYRNDIMYRNLPSLPQIVHFKMTFLENYPTPSDTFFRGKLISLYNNNKHDFLRTTNRKRSENRFRHSLIVYFTIKFLLVVPDTESFSLETKIQRSLQYIKCIFSLYYYLWIHIKTSLIFLWVLKLHCPTIASWQLWTVHIFVLLSTISLS